MPTRPPPPVGLTGPLAAGAGVADGSFRFGYSGVGQQELASASGPVCGALAKVIAIIPPTAKWGEDSISGTTARRNDSAPSRPAGCPGAQAVSEPSWQGFGTM